MTRPPADLAPEVWRRIPPAKQRLLTEGPLDTGTQPAFLAAIALAAELRLHGVTDKEALAAVNTMPFAASSEPPRRIRKQFARAVRFAYAPPNSQPILSGCCRDPRPHSGAQTPSTLRQTFAGYCDDACARSCPMLRGIKNPSRSLHDTAYADLDRSNLWMYGGGLGDAGRRAWQTLALIALAQGTDEIEGASRYVRLKLNGAYSARHLRRTLRAMDKIGLVKLLNKRTGLRRVPAHGPEWIAGKEHELGVAGMREANIREALAETSTYRDALAILTRGHSSLQDALDAWNPAPKR